MERRVFKIFPLTSSLFVFVYFLNLSCLSHRQKVSFGWSFKMLFLWCNIYKHSRFPNFAEVTAHRMAAKLTKPSYLVGSYIFFSVEKVVWKCFLNCEILKDREEKSGIFVKA